MRWVRLTAAGFLFWLILAAGLGGWTLLVGVLVAALVALAAVRVAALESAREPLSGRETLALIGFALWLIPMVLPAAWKVARVVMRRDLPVHPGVLYHRTALKRPISRTALANSITLTPGTHCVDLDDDLLTVHYLDLRFANSLEQRVLERRLAAILERPS